MQPAARLRDNELTIFLFHGVVEEHRHVVRNYLRKHIDRAWFSTILRELCAAGTPMSMDEVIEIGAAGRAFPPRAFAITFDDGFANNLTVAAPILDAAKLPATFYITTSFVQDNAMSWIDRIEWCFEELPTVSLRLPWNSAAVEAGDAAAKMALLSDIRAHVKADDSIDVDAFVSSGFGQCGVEEVRSTDDPLDRKMTWPELRELASHERFSVGGHSHTHAILSFLDPPALAAELDTSLALLRERAGAGPRHYSYPEGLAHCYSPAVIAALRERGVVCCPTAEDGTNPPGTSLFGLKRVMVT
jgi:peptidoglycan/xylan/chitin deacetylase (PgdA/CDA1 family)